eukprot:351440_1
MAQKRCSGRLQAKRASQHHVTSRQQQINAMRLSYSNDIPNYEVAFVRLIAPDQPLNNEEVGVIEIASPPQQLSMYNWSVRTVFFYCNEINEINAFNAVNDDKEYKKYLLTLTEEEWPKQDLFWDEHGIAGKPVKAIYKEAYKNGKRDATIKILTLMVHQILIYLCVKATSYLKDVVAQRGPEQKAHEHLPVFAWKDTKHDVGHSILSDISETHEKNNYIHTYDEINWNAMVDIVGISNVAKQIAKDVYIYSDITKIQWNETNHVISMSFVPVRWNGDDLRHRNIPILLKNE